MIVTRQLRRGAANAPAPFGLQWFRAAAAIATAVRRAIVLSAANVSVSGNARRLRTPELRAHGREAA